MSQTHLAHCGAHWWRLKMSAGLVAPASIAAWQSRWRRPLQLQMYKVDLSGAAGSFYHLRMPLQIIRKRELTHGRARRQSRRVSQAPCRLYLLTPPRIEDLAAFGRDLAHALDAGDVAALQIRLKDQAEEEIVAATRVITPIAQSRGVAVILNDRPDLARDLGCDGVHIGQEDAPYAQARRLLGPDATIGVTCHDSLHLAMEAAEAGADYVAFGSVFPTGTKDAKTRCDLDLIRGWAADMLVPCVAIGGITVDNAREVAAAGADFLAVSAGVWRHPDGPAAAVAALNREIEGAR